MGISNSSLWDAQKALAEALKEKLVGIRVDYGVPLDSELEHEHVFVSAKVTDWTFSHPVTNLDEDQDFTLIVGVYVMKAGDQEAIVARIKEITALIDEVIVDDYTLSGTVDMAVIDSARLMDGRDLQANKRQLALEIDVACTTQS